MRLQDLEIIALFSGTRKRKGSFFGLAMALLATILGCDREEKLRSGHYAVWDSEYSQDNYALRRHFKVDGTFAETHTLANCLVLEMQGLWMQKGSELKLQYRSSRERPNCRQELPAFKADSAALTIPIRHVDETSFESFLTASGGKAEKWLRWVRQG